MPIAVRKYLRIKGWCAVLRVILPAMPSVSLRCSLDVNSTTTRSKSLVPLGQFLELGSQLFYAGRLFCA